MRTPMPRALLGAALLLALAGCSTTPSTPFEQAAAPAPNRAASLPSVAQSGPAGAAAPVAPQSRVATVDLGAASAGAGTAAAGAAAAAPAAAARAGAAAGGAALLAAPSQRVVYFDFDSFAIRDDAKPVLEGHARVLSAAPNRRMSIEGHTDERGGREYNLALGQKRAEAVARSLALLGVREGQMEAVSFGKERPVATGSDEESWARNRRAELKDR